VLGLIDVLKASRREAEVLDVPALRQKLTVVVTDGKEGCTVLRGSARFHLPAFPAREMDPTGAGDCFLAVSPRRWRAGCPWRAPRGWAHGAERGRSSTSGCRA